VDFRFLSAGAEYDNNIKNTVLPYTLYRYFLHAQGTVLGRLSVFANGNYNHYPQLGREKNIHFMDLSGSVNYPFSRKASVSGAVSYMKQDGDKVNLDLLTCRARFDWLFHKIRGSLIYNFYDRKVFKEQIRSHAMNIELVRRF
jgi:long-subunit fatty acid transport protein